MLKSSGFGTLLGTVGSALLLTVLSFSAIAARPLDDVTASKLLRVFCYDDNKPFSWDEHGEAKGVDVEIGRALARELGVEAEVVLRMQGENVGDDLRANVWRGPLTGGGTGDVMLHVPVDRELASQNKEAVIGNAYFEERVSLAADPARAGDIQSYDAFKTMKVGVQLGTVADYFLMRYADGALVNNIAHHLKPEDGVKRFLAGETVALMGVRSSIESMLHEKGAAARWFDPPAPALVRKSWVVGTAVRENSRDLGYAIGAALQRLKDSGELAAIFAKHGVTYIAPAL